MGRTADDTTIIHWSHKPASEGKLLVCIQDLEEWPCAVQRMVDRNRQLAAALEAVEAYRKGERWQDGTRQLMCCAVCGGATAHLAVCIVGQALAAPAQEG